MHWARLSWKLFQRSRHLQGVTDHFLMYTTTLEVTEVNCTSFQMTIISIFHSLLTSSGKPTIFFFCYLSSPFQHFVYQTSKPNLFQRSFFPCPKFTLPVEVYNNDPHAFAGRGLQNGIQENCHSQLSRIKGSSHASWYLWLD